MRAVENDATMPAHAVPKELMQDVFTLIREGVFANVKAGQVIDILLALERTPIVHVPRPMPVEAPAEEDKVDGG